MRIQWCEEHAQAEYGVGLCFYPIVLKSPTPCRMVPMRLIPDNAETKWWCKSNRALRMSPGICTQRVVAHPQCCWVTIIEEPQWFQLSEQRPTSIELTAALDGETP